MSIETAMAALNTPAPSATPPQQQALTNQEVAAAVTESETKTKTSEASPAETSKDGGVVDAAKTAEAAKPKEEPISSKFTALAKKEKAIVERDQKTKAKEQGLAEREAKIAEREAKIKQSENLWDTDVFEALKLRGYDYQKLTELMLEGKSAAPTETDPVKLAKKTIEDFKKEQQEERTKAQEESKKAQEASDAKQREEVAAAWDAYKAEINEFVNANKDDYELISLYAQQGLVADTVNEFYQQNKRVLSVKEASDIVENYLLDEAKKAMSSKKLGGLKAESKKEEPKKEAAQSKTLNNNMQPTSASVLPAQSDNDRMKRAMAALEGKR